ncbi:hypothetical protein MMC10_005735 [Thelotrema lepadinum]|nr:hypothetical protein [Thelotrema lepadinum]
MGYALNSGDKISNKQDVGEMYMFEWSTVKRLQERYPDVELVFVTPSIKAQISGILVKINGEKYIFCYIDFQTWVLLRIDQPTRLAEVMKAMMNWESIIASQILRVKQVAIFRAELYEDAGASIEESDNQWETDWIYEVHRRAVDAAEARWNLFLESLPQSGEE